MATYIKGSAVENATSYKLYIKEGTSYTELATQNEGGEINFKLDDYSLEDGTYTFVVKAFDSTGNYDDSSYSNEVECTIGESTSGDSSGEEEPVVETTTYYGTDVSVVSSPSELDFVAGYNGGTSANGFTTSTGRSCSITQCVAVTGGETLVLSQPISGVTLTYAIKEFTDKPLDATTITTTGQVAGSWLSGIVELQSDTKYIVIVFKRGNGSSDFTDEELELLKEAITIS